MQLKLVLVSVLALASTSAFGQGFWTNRQQVYMAAEQLAEEVERLDAELHQVNAPRDLISAVHHFGDTVAEFSELVRYAPYQEAAREMNHIRQDIGLLRNGFARYPQLQRYPRVATEWRHVLASYRNLDHQMTFGGGHRWPHERVRELQRDLQELQAEHAN